LGYTKHYLSKAFSLVIDAEYTGTGP